MTEQPSPPKAKQRKPKWLRKLERESWQPELIISGAAIFGSVQLPGLLTQMENYFLLEYDRDTLFICFIAMTYWRILVNGLILTFIFHFIVRALWIGMAGLNSVFPGGFRSNERFSPKFQEKMRAEYGDVDGLIARLDRLGSGIFGIAFAGAGVFLNFGLIGLVLIALHSWLVGLGIPSGRVLTIIGLFLAPIFLLSLVSMFSHARRWRDSRLVNRFQWPITQVISRFTYPLARHFIVTASNLVTSYYADRKTFTWYYLLGFLAMIGVGMSSVMFNDNIRLFVDPVYHRIANDSLMLPTGYAGEAEYEGVYYRPEILDPADGGGPTEQGLRVWVPLPEREMVYLLADCSRPEVDAELPQYERRYRQWERTVGCGREYLSFSVNGRPLAIAGLERQYRSNPAGEQYGMTAYLADPPLVEGRNLLRVTMDYPHVETGEPRVAYQAFYHY